MKVYNFKKDGNVGHLYIFGVITPWAWPEYGEVSATTFMDEVNQLVDSCDEIFIHINSPGGDVAEGLAIVSLIQACTKPTTCINEGVAFSMGAIIMQAGGKRIASKGSLLMFHSASSYVSGNKIDLTDAAEMLDKFDEALASIISEKSGKSLEDVKTTYFDGKDHFMTAEEALADGFIDSISETSAVLPKNVADFHNRSAVVAAYSDIKNFEQQHSKTSLLDAIRNFITPNNKGNMDEVRTVLALDAKADNKAIVSAVRAIIKDRDDAKVTVENLTTEKQGLEKKVTDITTERDRLQAIVDKIPEGMIPSLEGGDTPLGSDVNDFVTDPVTAVAQKISNSFKNNK